MLQNYRERFKSQEPVQCIHCQHTSFVTMSLLSPTVHTYTVYRYHSWAGNERELQETAYIILYFPWMASTYASQGDAPGQAKWW